jgi:hypothetical protein
VGSADHLVEELLPDLVLKQALAVLGELAENRLYRVSAERVRREIAAMPGPELAVELLERLARDNTPIIASRRDDVFQQPANEASLGPPSSEGAPRGHAALRQRLNHGLAAMRLAADRPLRREPVPKHRDWPLPEWQLNSK